MFLHNQIESLTEVKCDTPVVWGGHFGGIQEEEPVILFDVMRHQKKWKQI
jgi:hypothetical protein